RTSVLSLPAVRRCGAPAARARLRGQSNARWRCRVEHGATIESRIHECERRATMKTRMSRQRLLIAMMALPMLAHAAEDALLLETRAVATAMPPKLMAELQKEMAAGGLVSAIAACRDTAPQMA